MNVLKSSITLQKAAYSILPGARNSFIFTLADRVLYLCAQMDIYVTVWILQYVISDDMF